jgi:hypothetical protein
VMRSHSSLENYADLFSMKSLQSFMKGMDEGKILIYFTYK